VDDLATLTIFERTRSMMLQRAVRLQVGELLAADATTFAPAADENKIALITSEFTPSEDLDLETLTLASGDGLDPIAGATGTQQVGIDAETGDQIITIKDPAGGYRWEVTGVVALPLDVQGFILINDAGDEWYAVEKFETPIHLDAIGQEINIGKATVAILQQLTT